MKRIYTSYFGAIRKYQFDKNKCYSIARKPPYTFKGGFIFELAPSIILLYSYLQHKINIKQYTKIFNSQLEGLDCSLICNKLQDGSILLCYEKPDVFCHRHLVADWINKNIKTTICKEFTI